MKTFSSSAALRAHQNIDKPDGDISVNKRKREGITTSTQSTSEEKPNYVNNFDVALYRDKCKGMGTPKLCSLIRNVLKPDKQCDFPKTNGRKFLFKWLELYSWICYSPSKDDAYCLSLCAVWASFSW